jgi:hypothetical protein
MSVSWNFSPLEWASGVRRYLGSTLDSAHARAFEIAAQVTKLASNALAGFGTWFVSS